ncbi:MAG: hypothetical protein OIF36_05575 [Alphaproteobacteria bacterium]|nr:hypothetical protein [Alphaproteobacteria bacterium]
MILENKSNIPLTKIITFNDVLFPLIFAISKKTGIANTKETCDVEAILLAKLVENTLGLSKKYIQENNLDNYYDKKLKAISNISKIVAANYSHNQSLLSDDVDLSNVSLDGDVQVVQYNNENEFKDKVFEVMSDIVNVVNRFNFALEEERIISGVKTQIIKYANDIFLDVEKDKLEESYFNHLYLDVIKNLTELFSVCYYSEIDAVLSVPLDKREDFIHRHLVETRDSVEKALDAFYSRTSIIMNMSKDVKIFLENKIKEA